MKAFKIDVVNEFCTNRIGLKDGSYLVSLKPQNRTSPQNRALHLWFTMVAQTLNDSGLDNENILNIPIEWNEISIKELMIKPLMKQILKKTSTTQLLRCELDRIIDPLFRYFASKGVILPDFPSEETKQY